MKRRPRIAHLAGPTATIQNTPPLVTSNKARAKYGAELLPNPDGSSARFDVLRAQRLAAPVTVYLEQFSAHPLEADAAELYGPPDGYLDAAGSFSRERTSADDKAVYEVQLRPEDGLYPMPYMARQADGSAWDEECAFPGAPADKARQGFFPDGSRSFEEIDRLAVGREGLGNLISAKADIDFHRILPPAGYTKGLAANRRTDSGSGDIPPERHGTEFFAYKPVHLSQMPPRPALARIANAIQDVLGGSDYDGAIWTEGSPFIEETIYWLNLICDTTLPICGNSAQRPHGQMSNDGSKNIVDSVDYIVSRVWADESGRNRAGAVVIAEQRIFAARAITKIDARPGGYEAAGGHGGILGAAGHIGRPLIHYWPAMRHTFRSEVNLTRLPNEVFGVRRQAGRGQLVPVVVKGGDGRLLEAAVPKVHIIKDGYFSSDDYESDVEREVDLIALLDRMLDRDPLAGWVIEGASPYGIMTSIDRHRLTLRAAYSGIPVVRVGRGNTEGFASIVPPFIGGSNLTAVKARILLMACLLRLGSLPPAVDPDHPTPDEIAATHTRVAAYQELFDTH